jgi:hypothetical protein
MAITAAALRTHTDFPTETRITGGTVTVLQPRVQDETALFLASRHRFERSPLREKKRPAQAIRPYQRLVLLFCWFDYEQEQATTVSTND